MPAPKLPGRVVETPKNKPKAPATPKINPKKSTAKLDDKPAPHTAKPSGTKKVPDSDPAGKKFSLKRPAPISKKDGKADPKKEEVKKEEKKLKEPKK